MEMIGKSKGSEATGRYEGQRFIAAVIFLLTFAMAARTPLDSDMWWHLRAGRESALAGRPMTTDTFSYTQYGENWVNHSWLSQVGMYWVFELWGYPGLATMVALLAAASMLLVYAQMEGHPVLRGFVVVLAVTVAAVVWSPRPQMASLLLFGVVGYILYAYKWRHVERLWTLPVIFVLWSNLHGGYVLGLLLMGAMISGEVLNHMLGFEGREVVAWRGIGRLAIWTAASGLAVAINPNGAAMWLIPFRTVEVGALQEYISEWASPDFHQLFQQPFLWLLLGTLGAAGVSKRRLDGTDLVGVAGFAYLALVARRNFGPFAMVAAPVLSRHLWVLGVGWAARTRPRIKALQARWNLPDWGRPGGAPPAVIRRAVNGAVIGMLVIAGAVKVYAVTRPEVVAYFEGQVYPVRAVEWIRANRPPGRLFNEYNWGGYLLWHLPEYRVFVDGRTDLYDDEVLGEWLAISSGGKGALDGLDRYEVNLVLVEGTSELGRRLQASGGWIKTAGDEVGRVYVRK